MPLISVIVPIYNSEDTIKRGIKCLLNQTFKNIEIILINDGSTDNSGIICDQLARENNNIKVIHKENEGAGSARNEGIKISLGKYLLFYDIDDLLSPNMLKVLYEKAIEKDYDLVICSHKDVHIESDIITVKRENQIEESDLLNSNKARKSYIQFHSQGIIQAPWAKLYKTSIIKDNNLYFPDLRRCQDIIFNINYYQYISKVCTLKESYYYYYTPNSEFYLNKFPRDMFDILKYVNSYIKMMLESWGELNIENLNYLNNNMMNDVFLALRLCENTKWKMNFQEKKEYIFKIINDQYVEQVFSTASKKWVYKIIYALIKIRQPLIFILLNKGVIIIQRKSPNLLKKIK